MTMFGVFLKSIDVITCRKETGPGKLHDTERSHKRFTYNVEPT
jgi:hypothetical protein